MKKITAIVAIGLLGTFVLPSCKKDYTCTCKDTSTGDSVASGHWKTTKKDAKALCNKLENVSGGSLECSID